MTLKTKTRRELYSALFPKHAVGAELGVEAGENAIDLLMITQPRKLYLCDVWEVSREEIVKQRFADVPEVETVKQADCEWLESLPAGSLDWVYIDTLHNYEQTTKELLACRGRVTQIVSGHDWCCTSTLHNVSFISEWTHDGGTLLAVIEQIQNGWLELAGITIPDETVSPADMYPSWVCRVKE